MDIYNDVVQRLGTLGFTVTAEPDSAVTYAIDRAAEIICAEINQTQIPDALRYTWVDMASGLFLSDKKAAGQLGAAFDFTAPAKKITEGKVTVEFSDADTAEVRFDSLLNKLIHPPKQIFAAFRRIKW